MENDIMCQYEHYHIAFEMWLALSKILGTLLQPDFGGTFVEFPSPYNQTLTAYDQVWHV